ncbi:carboxymuconolactone decarboxylase family protein [Amycolatopsis suaedae]|uniref:Carboxymuconolactone decarboxylase family protein n=1 Tax=Amycolatopsis suaedae TaxID=2510978 RepID=A0A4Q7JC44_9PSEU|nr:carboxymuconolactone decarboxylase family protein [Amycolatopsis suaedae]RZQ64592.1 carboxymuconolactone decarboxylase family protein [Amycolatopsis suaedae]
MDKHPTTEGSGLGGRLPLVPPEALDQAQRALYDRLQATRVRDAGRAAYTASLPDGRLVGPFNVMLRVPRIAGPLLEWAQAITRSGIPEDVREVVILTVAAHWRAEYALYAHTAAAERAGVSEAVIAALRQGEAPRGLRAEADVAHRVAVALVRDHDVPDDLYQEAAAAFGTETLVALVNLIGQYLNTSALLTCFQVPAPAA